MAGQVEMLVILGGINPVYTAPADLKFSRSSQGQSAVYHGLYADETAYLCHWHIPDTHPARELGRCARYDGTVTLIQPLIAPLYEGRSAREVLSVFTPQARSTRHAIVKDYWTRAFAAAGWTIRPPMASRSRTPTRSGAARCTTDSSRHRDSPTAAGNAVLAAPAPAATRRRRRAAPRPPHCSPNRSAAPALARRSRRCATAGARRSPHQSRGRLELIFRPDPTSGTAASANNGWLQELPKPLTKVTWDTTAWISPQLAKDRGLRDGDVIELKYRGNTARMPIFRVPGHPQQSVTVFFGYGRRMAGTSATRRRRRAVQRVSAAHVRRALVRQRPRDRKDRRTYPLATTQEHHLMEGRAPVRVATLEEYRNEPAIIQEQGEKPLKTLTMYPDYKYDGNKWGMAIDLSSCTGCSACTIACVAENNIPVVGREQVAKGREMHWIRVDHYFAGNDYDTAVEAYHQPVPCMQCENAPCELVCPVAATTHSSEGLNDMVYNRCVGTRYCSNNCPYKVRRFNFLLYQDWTRRASIRCAIPTSRFEAAASWRSAPTACSGSTRHASTPSARIGRSATARSCRRAPRRARRTRSSSAT
jgi:molybdopterin-containing oxidoreductase family iron-sulfur binding subunit